MKSINEVYKIIQDAVPSVVCIVSPAMDQIAVQFKNRPDVVIHLLTPYYQNKLKTVGLSDDDIHQLINDVKLINDRSVYTATVIEDVESFLKKL